MQKDPYLVLGLTKGASEEEVTAKYNELKEQYSNDRFVEGEVGMNAARKLSELDQAYNDCIEDITISATMGTGNAYSNIENIIKEGKYDDAQRLLDDIDVRDAEWHYYQSMVYFKKGWHTESKTQLEICLALDPHNTKYNTALDKMNNFMKNDRPFNNANAQGNNAQSQANNQQTNQARQNNQSEQRAGYSDRQTNADNNANACCDSCCTLMCCDSCCECMGGDLIPCC